MQVGGSGLLTFPWKVGAWATFRLTLLISLPCPAPADAGPISPAAARLAIRPTARVAPAVDPAVARTLVIRDLLPAPHLPSVSSLSESRITPSMAWSVYLAGEIHSDWRERIADGAKRAGLDAVFTSPVTDHGASDDVGVAVLGDEPESFWKDHKGAGVNAIRTQTLIRRADVVVVRF